MHRLVLDSRRFGTVAERAAYLRLVEEHYRDVEVVMNQLMALPTWSDRSPGWVDDQLVLVTAVVHQIGTLRGEYDDARACTLRQLGHYDEAYDEFAAVLPEILADDIPDAVLSSCEDFACVLFDMGRDRDGALLLGAAMAERDGTGVPRMAFQEAALATSVAAGRQRLGGDWEALLGRGAELGVLAAVATALRAAER